MLRSTRFSHFPLPLLFRRRRIALAAAGLLAGLSGPTLAQDSAAALPEMTVTGEKSERSLMQTAPSVRVFGERELADQTGIIGTNELLNGVANITSTGTGNLAPAVRGVDGTGPAQGADAFLAGTRPRLSVQVDGRSSSYNEVVFGDLGLWDVQRVEVFRGAQSTLQGRNAIAGTIIYKTNDPGFAPEVGIRAAVASQDQRQLSAVINAPLVDQELAVRLALDGFKYKSYAKGYEPYPGVSDPGQFESGNVRGKILWKPQAVPGLTNLLTIDRNIYTGPQTESVARPFDDKVISYPSMPTFSPRSTSAVLDTTYEISPTLTFENRIVSGDTHVTRKAMPGDGNANIRVKDLQIEPRLRFATQDKQWTGFVGLYTFGADQDDDIDLFGGGAWTDKTRTWALYGEVTTPLSSSVDLTLGGRYEEERRERNGALSIFTTDFDATYKVFLPKATLAWKLDPATTLGSSISRGYNGGGAAFTYDVPFTNYQFDPEYAWTLEAFGRKRLLDGALLLTGNLFYSDYKNMQLPFDLNPDPNVWAYVVRNAPRAHTYGAELGAQWQVSRSLRFTGEVGLLETKITEYPGSGVEGHELPRSPAFTMALGLSWRGQSGLELGADARYSSAYYSDVTNFSRGKVDPGWLANVRASYPVGKARLFAYVNNVFDSKRPLLVDADPNAVTDAFDTANLPRPRTVGVGVEAWF